MQSAPLAQEPGSLAELRRLYQRFVCDAIAFCFRNLFRQFLGGHKLYTYPIMVIDECSCAKE
jgi:hypothetical protein